MLKRLRIIRKPKLQALPPLTFSSLAIPSFRAGNTTWLFINTIKKYLESLETLEAIQLGKDGTREYFGGKVSDLLAAVYHFMNENKIAEIYCKRALKIFRKPGLDERHLMGSMLLLIRILDRQGKIIERDFYKTLLPKSMQPEVKK